MSFTDRNQSAKALKEHKNEVTVTIMSKKENTNYHETFMLDTSLNNSFEFDGITYNIPAEKTQHYHPSFWKFDVKLGMFFEKHKLIAKFLDWFKFREKAVFEIGYLYWEGEPNPVPLVPQEWDSETKTFKPFDSPFDYSIEIYNLMKNTSFKDQAKEVENVFKKPGISMKSIMIFLILIIGMVAAVAIAYVFFGKQPDSATVQNATATIGAIHP